MASRIKGITVEIGGDVTGLDKALKKVNGDIKNTQTQLKDVERLLKLDPKNVVLLEQKQRLLNKSTDELRQKQEALKQALEGVTVDDAKWAEWEKAQADFARQTAATEKELAQLKKRAEELEKQGVAPDSEELALVTEKISFAEQKLEDLRNQSVSTYEQMGKPITQDSFDRMNRELIDTEQQLDKAEKASDKFNIALEKVGVTAKQVADKAAGVADATKGLSAAAGVVAGALTGMAISAGKAADDLNTMSRQSGFSTQTLQEWQYASDRIDVSVETMVGAATKLKKNMTSTSADVVRAFSDLGIGVRDNEGKLRDIEGVFNDVVFGLSQIQNETERDTIAMTLFGRSADELAGVIDDGGAALREYGKEAEDLGLVLSQDALDGANQFNDGLDIIKARAQAAFMEAGAALAEKLLPELDKLVDGVTKVIQWFSRLDGGTLKLIGTIAILVAAISPIARIISGVGNAINGVSGIATLFSNVAGNSVYLTFAKWAIIIAAVAAALSLLIALIATLTGKSEEVNRTISNIGNATKGQIPAFANGGILTEGSALVGENGAEMLTMRNGAAVVQPLERSEPAQPRPVATRTDVNINFTGSLSQLGRVLQPVVTAQTNRVGSVI